MVPKKCLVPLAWFCFCLSVTGIKAIDLASSFRHPPASARPWVYWFWINGNITREGITADLESMHRVGIGGVVIMDVDVFIPKGPVRFLSPEWRSMFRHALKESARLGIEVAMNNDSGWSGSGGPWVKPEQAMQMIVWSETRLSGPLFYDALVAQPKTNEGFYKDIALLAFPTPKAEIPSMAAANPRVTWNNGSRELDAARLFDGNAATLVVLPSPGPGRPHVLEMEFREPFSARALHLSPDRSLSLMQGRLEVSDDGREYSPVCAFTGKWPFTVVSFALQQSRRFRITLSPSGSDTTPLTLGELVLTGGERIDGITAKAAYISEPFLPGMIHGSATSDGTIPRNETKDLTARMDSSGHLSWEVPAGDWTLLRIGHTPTGRTNNSSTAEGKGLECDKLNTEAVDAHFIAMMGRLVADQEAEGVRSMRYVHIDSWEAGSQNWTARLREEFQKRNGYDLTPFLPVMTGRVVDSREISERFLWDLRRTLADLVNDNYAGRMRELSRNHGLKLSMEPYGNGPLDDLAYARQADLLLTEFWMGYEPWWGIKETVSAAHIYGHTVAAAEAFTSRAAASRWQSHPLRLKPLGDRMFAAGINRFVLHRFALQPWLHRAPGMTMGPYGTEFDRTVTWWEQSNAYMEYLARCQYLLQQGLFQADIGYLNGERVPGDFHQPVPLSQEPPAGYDYDLVPAGILGQLEVRGGRLTLPSGRSYRLLVLPPAGSMRVAQIRRIEELVKAGAIVVGPPPSGSPSLAESGAGDQEVRRLAGELWNGLDGIDRTENRRGRGRIVWGKTLAGVLQEEGVPPDFSSLGVEVGTQIRYLHRMADGKDIYFIASAQSQAATFLCSFRVADKVPEFWWPDTGRIERAAVYDRQANLTRIPVRLEPYGSVFVVFGDANASESISAFTRNHVEVTGLRATSVVDLRGMMLGFSLTAPHTDGYRLEVSKPGVYAAQTTNGRRLWAQVSDLPEPMEIAGPWEVSFPKGSGVADRIVLDRLVSWTDHPHADIRHFSGTAAYRLSLRIPPGILRESRRLYLDLGHIGVIAEVKLNGRELGILWKPPFRIDITAAVQTGGNELEVRVTNLWINRLIGDEILPEDAVWEGPRLKAWPQWLLEGKPSPTGRSAFTTYKLWHKGDPLMESGLIGPVRLEVTETVPLSVQESPGAFGPLSDR